MILLFFHCRNHIISFCTAFRCLEKMGLNGIKFSISKSINLHSFMLLSKFESYPWYSLLSSWTICCIFFWVDLKYRYGGDNFSLKSGAHHYITSMISQYLSVIEMYCCWHKYSKTYTFRLWNWLLFSNTFVFTSWLMKIWTDF